ncbi:MAG: acyl-CoA thioesterase [Melioribacteraceae bacterium]|nr:acyl-CoA thioesterase [Melioribacteraceae bacterium]MCF8414146.1 acyl-CoA thioesterase [Melioribacteraceae bacterium]
MNQTYSIFETILTIRPDDIDMNGHVHNSRYLDYVLAARYDQMKKDYKMSMDEFIKQDLGWVVSAVNIEFKRALFLGEQIKVKTQVESASGAQVKVNFLIEKFETGKVASEGQFLYTMISTKTGRPARITEEIISQYSI